MGFSFANVVVKLQRMLYSSFCRLNDENSQREEATFPEVECYFNLLHLGRALS